MEKIHTIITHPMSHLDEIVGIVLLRISGESFYPGIENAVIEFCDAGTTPGGKNWKQLEKEGVLLIGLGGGRFDEHPTPTTDRKERVCAATLVAQHLGIEKEQWLAKLLKYTTANDLNGGTNPFDLAAMINRMNKRYFKKDPQKAVMWAINAVEDYIWEQMEFFITSKEEFAAVATVSSCTHKRRAITVVSMTSDNEQLGAYARSSFGANADVIIQKNSKGHVFITTKKSSAICLDEVARCIRLNEMRKKNITYRNLSDPALKNDGVVKGSQEWSYQKNANMLLNGARSAPNVVPTKLSIERIVKIVLEKLSEIRHANNSLHLRKAS